MLVLSLASSVVATIALLLGLGDKQQSYAVIEHTFEHVFKSHFKRLAIAIVADVLYAIHFYSVPIPKIKDISIV
jgi:hypothetical protein